jgi:hypothetical protein
MSHFAYFISHLQIIVMGKVQLYSRWFNNWDHLSTSTIEALMGDSQLTRVICFFSCTQPGL